jgi:UDP-2,3-diacylglucosamine pyrophosphatase LpxH
VEQSIWNHVSGKAAHDVVGIKNIFMENVNLVKFKTPQEIAIKIRHPRYVICHREVVRTDLNQAEEHAVVNELDLSTKGLRNTRTALETLKETSQNMQGTLKIVLIMGSNIGRSSMARDTQSLQNSVVFVEGGDTRTAKMANIRTSVASRRASAAGGTLSRHGDSRIGETRRERRDRTGYARR